MRQRHRKSLVTLVRVGSEAVDVSGRGVTIHQHCLTGKEWSSESAVHQRRADHLLSDAIFFIAADVEELVMLYLAWLNCCGGRLAVEQVKPWGYLCLPSDQVKASGKEDFVMRCCLSRYAGARGPEEMQSDGFQMLAFLADQVAPEVVEKAARRGRRQRAARGQLWTQAQVRRIRSAVEEHEAAGERSPMSIAASLSTPPPCLQPGSDWARVLLACEPQPAVFELIASYLAHHACTSANWACWPRGWLAKPDCDHHFTRHHFTAQYRPALRRLFLLAKVTPTLAALNTVYAKWRGRLAERVALTVAGDALRSHLAVLRDCRHIVDQADFGFSCAACLAAPWLALLPCGRHGLCNRCAIALDAAAARSAVAHVSCCAVCGVDFAPFALSVRPALARGRILALDGGGVRGLVQLEILALIEQSMALGIPITRFFDLIVGTSVGGINALALGLNRWTVVQCRERLAAMSREVFAAPSRATQAMSWITGGWSALAGKMLRVWLNNAIYDSTTLEGALQSCFGPDTPLIGPTGDAPAVAITTTTPGTPACALFTTYNKSSHPPSPSYVWHQRQHSTRAIRVWEAARCTSAAPVYFPAKVVSGNVYWDGGPLHTNPVDIATSEGAMLWECAADENLVVSVGCGQMKLVSSGDHWAKHLWSIFDHLSSGANQGAQRVTTDALPNYARLDPMLGIESIGLDDIDSMLSLQTRIGTLIRGDESFNHIIATCAWKLIASSFFGEARRKNKDSIIVDVCGRLSASEHAKIRQKHPDCYFSINHGSSILPVAHFPCSFEILLECSKLDITLNTKCHSASISGFPTTIEKILHSFGQPSTFDRKRGIASIDNS